VSAVQVWLKRGLEQALSLRAKNRLAFDLACGFLAAVILAVAMLAAYSSEESSLLVSNLSPPDMAALEMRLRRRGISYVAGQDWIRVAAGRLNEAKELLLSGPGFSGGQSGFALFDRPALGASDFVEQVAYQRALQGELERTIMDMRSVENARVMLAMSRPSPFALAPEQSSRAAVMVTPVPGAIIDNITARAIAHLVASSLPGLKPDDVSVTLNDGSVLFPLPHGSAFSEAVVVRQKIEQALEGKAEQILQKVMGTGRYVAEVSVELDERKHSETMHLYGAGNKPAVVSEEHNQEPVADKTALGIPGLTSNLPAPSALPTQASQNRSSPSNSQPGTPTGAQSATTATLSTPSYSRRDIVNYQPSSREIHESREAFGVKRISIAAVVDGVYKGGAFEPQPEGRLKEIKALLVAAVGADPARGDIVEVTSAALARPYVPPPPSLTEQLRELFSNLTYLGAAVALGLAIVSLGSWFAVRALRKRRLASKLKKQISEISETTATLDKARAETKPEQDLRLRVNLEAERDPAAVAAILRKWMDESGSGAGGSHAGSGGLSEAA
jgi:flagellar M-ring protein FliF